MKRHIYEMEVREKMVGRVQINFALIATGFAILSYMVKMTVYLKIPKSKQLTKHSEQIPNAWHFRVQGQVLCIKT
ncbi:hypothetical protein VCHA39O220_340007 [Vibrio chagasii]|nr:hypothetical protein VCHA39O220_340007 [Vibrio chagasii]CAH7345412.1 hypothetical protein VCHA39O224_210060 [Vibrio chagasii]CAH7446673.1 hypothetical protein VCHA37P192_40416 [Vibrio chagasii]